IAEAARIRECCRQILAAQAQDGEVELLIVLDERGAAEHLRALTDERDLNRLRETRRALDDMIGRRDVEIAALQPDDQTRAALRIVTAKSAVDLRHAAALARPVSLDRRRGRLRDQDARRNRDNRRARNHASPPLRLPRKNAR